MRHLLAVRADAWLRFANAWGVRIEAGADLITRQFTPSRMFFHQSPSLQGRYRIRLEIFIKNHAPPDLIGRFSWSAVQYVNSVDFLYILCIRSPPPATSLSKYRLSFCWFFRRELSPSNATEIKKSHYIYTVRPVSENRRHTLRMSLVNSVSYRFLSAAPEY
jgi:hypothetical protein